MAAYLLFLIIAASEFSTLTVDAQLTIPISIDCGAFGNYTDDYSIRWYGDDNFIKHGESVEVQSSNSVSPAMSTLRVFKERKKSCYSMLAVKGSKVLVRASFFYGNYDGKSSPPSFDLQFDGNHWTTVETSDQVVSHEAIYVTKWDAISVCVAQTSPNMFPFVSAIEVRVLELKMYAHFDSKYALILSRRVAYGTKEIRYIDDVYDRIWLPAINGGDFIVLTSEESLIEVSFDDNPPQAVFQNAFATNSTSTYIILGTNLPTTEVPIYMNMYFSEVSVLDSTQKRSFELYIDDKPTSNPFVPVYGKGGEMYLTNFTASSNTNFSLVATSDSTLPPLINALEVFTLSDELTDGTNSNDVKVLASLWNNFRVLRHYWYGDPCLHSQYTWDWINCSTDSTPRVTALYLNNFSLCGSLPNFSSMTALEIIELQNNNLIGSIPEFLGTLPNLKYLNLANNMLSGSIPSSIFKNTNLKFVYAGNPYLCVPGESCKTANANPACNSPAFSPSSGHNGSKKPVVLGTTIPTSLLILCAIVFAMFFYYKRSAAGNAGQARGAGMARAESIVENIISDSIENYVEEQV